MLKGNCDKNENDGKDDNGGWSLMIFFFLVIIIIIIILKVPFVDSFFVIIFF